MSEEIKVTNIEVQMGEQLVGMTPAQARELLSQLKKLFGDESKTQVVDRYIPVPSYRPYISWLGA